MNELKVVHGRRGLGRVGRRLRDGRPITVAYLGGSITEGAHASDPDRFSYRARTAAWLGERHRGSAVRQINAGIGGTGSDYGAMRAGPHVFDHDPDLLFVEFAVNDHDAPEPRVIGSMEGIVRRAMAAKRPVDVCLIHTLADRMLDDYRSGRLPRAVRLHEQVATHYGVASINVGLAVARQLEAGRLEWSAFSGDGCHPTDLGFAQYTHTMTDALPALLDAPAADATRPEPITDHPWTDAALRKISPSDATGAWRFVPLQRRRGHECYAGRLESDQPDARLRFAVAGRVVGLVLQIGPASGDLDVQLDDRPPRTVRPFDRWCLDNWRSKLFLLEDHLPAGEHRLSICPAGAKDSRSSGYDVRLLAIASA
jgi:lysophospholipase L1-like esterase